MQRGTVTFFTIRRMTACARSAWLSRPSRIWRRAARPSSWQRMKVHGWRDSVAEAGRVTRVSRLMALAIRFEQLIRAGEVTGCAELATLGHVTRARMSQIMCLLCLAPDVQEEVLFLPRTLKGRDPIQLRHLLPIARIAGWARASQGVDEPSPAARPDHRSWSRPRHGLDQGIYEA